MQLTKEKSHADGEVFDSKMATASFVLFELGNSNVVCYILGLCALASFMLASRSRKKFLGAAFEHVLL